MRVHVPPGRTGRLWLRRRLAVARRGLDLLDRKLRLLREEQDRLVRLAEETAQVWTQAVANADTWSVRAAVLGGDRALQCAIPEALADIDVIWTDVLGTSYPAEVACRFPDPPDLLPLTAALAPAQDAARTAVLAGARHAAALAAVDVVETEVAATRRRIRALRQRWVPSLEKALTDRETALDETERADTIRATILTRNEPLPNRM